jgi:hypothetical protein
MKVPGVRRNSPHASAERAFAVGICQIYLCYSLILLLRCPSIISRFSSSRARGGTGTLRVDGKLVATQKIERTVPIVLQFVETFDVGADTGTPVDDLDYQVPFKFTGKLNKLRRSVHLLHWKLRCTTAFTLGAL